MVYETKFNVGDYVWMMNKNTPQAIMVEGIRIQHTMRGQKCYVMYTLKNVIGEVNEASLFRNKCDLIFSL